MPETRILPPLPKKLDGAFRRVVEIYFVSTMCSPYIQYMYMHIWFQFYGLLLWILDQNKKGKLYNKVFLYTFGCQEKLSKMAKEIFS